MDTMRNGAIPLGELADIARYVQETVDRISRGLNKRDRAGRSPESFWRLSALDAVGIDPGSAVLQIEAPHDPELLPIALDAADAGVQAIELMVQALAAIAEGNQIPPQVAGPARRSLSNLVRVFDAHDHVTVEATSRGHTVTAALAPGMTVELSEEPEPPTPVPRPVEIVGELYGVDIHNHTYRIEDQFGRARRVSIGEDLDDRSLARALLGDVVHVTALPSNADAHGRPGRFIAISIGRIDPRRTLEFETMEFETMEFETWDIETAMEKVSPLGSIDDLDGERFESFRDRADD